jgi:hypothetical protein
MVRKLLSAGLFTLSAWGSFACSGARIDKTDGSVETRVGSDVALGEDAAHGRTGVEECASYDSYMAALGELTVDCLGTLDPRAYEVTNDGILRPTFRECSVDPSRMLPIKQLLSLQARTARLPRIKQCMVDRFALAKQRFLNSGVNACPIWKDKGIINPISTSTIAAMLKETPLPDLDASSSDHLRAAVSTGNGAALSKETPPTDLDLSGSDEVRPDDKVFETLEQRAFYTLSLDNAPPQQCEGPGGCAELCAAAFPGFLISTDGNRAITDPVAWLIDTMYPARAADPYLNTAYYHPMSFYGPLPGAIYGSYSRFQACDPADPINCPPEACSYWAGTHIKRRLQKDCIDPTDISTCVSYCGPTLP